MGFFYFFVTILMAVGSWWAGSKAWEEFSTGDFSGIVTLQDGASPEYIQIEARFKGNVVAQTSPAPNGIYQMSVKTGAYSISFHSNGYKPIEIPISIQSGMTPVADLALEVVPKEIEILLVDKHGRTYPNIVMQLAQIGQLGSTSKAITELHFNQNGQAKTPQISFGDYGLVLMSPISGDRTFLWVSGKSQASYPGFRLKVDTQSYKIVLPRVLYAEQSGPNSALTYKPTNERFFAQSFTTIHDLDICGVGFGIGIGGYGLPAALQIRTDSSQYPGSEILWETRPNKFSASLSNVRSGSFGDNCESQMSTNLRAGTYWVVAKYDSLPEHISLLGGSDLPSGRIPMKTSIDGKSWTDFSFDYIKMLDFFLTE